MSARPPISVEAVQSLLTTLVRCPSVNPGSHGDIVPPYGEAGMVDILQARLRKLGGDVHSVDVLPGRPNVLARFPGHDPTRTLLLDAHTDTVSHLNMRVDPFGAEVREARLYGRGACDTKGPMAALLLGLEAAMSAGGPACNVIVAGTCDEENGATGARHLAEQGLPADAAIVFEPTGCRIVTAHKGAMRASITVHGTACHSSAPHQGRNAIYPMARVIAALEDLAADLKAREPHPRLGTPTLAVTTIEGGTAVNIVPDRCVIQVDRRLLPNERSADAKGEIEDRVRAACDGGKEPIHTIEWTQYYPALETPADSTVVTELETALQAVTGQALRDQAAYGTNGGYYAQAGIPSVVFGPGDIAQAHTEAECIDLNQVATAAEVVYHLLRSPATV
jgi:succinyl-diaminopimelate desuccinylase